MPALASRHFYSLFLCFFPILFFRPISIVFAFVFEDSRPADGFAIARAADCFQQEGFLSFFLLLFHGNYLSLQPFAVPEASLGRNTRTATRILQYHQLLALIIH